MVFLKIFYEIENSIWKNVFWEYKKDIGNSKHVGEAKNVCKNEILEEYIMCDMQPMQFKKNNSANEN